MVAHHPYPRLFLESLPMRHHGVKNDGEMSFEAGKPSFVSISSMDFINSNHLYQFHQSQENQKLENRFLGQFLTGREFGLYGLNNHMDFMAFEIYTHISKYLSKRIGIIDV